MIYFVQFSDSRPARRLKEVHRLVIRVDGPQSENTFFAKTTTTTTTTTTMRIHYEQTDDKLRVLLLSARHHLPILPLCGILSSYPTCHVCNAFFLFFTFYYGLFREIPGNALLNKVKLNDDVPPKVENERNPTTTTEMKTFLPN